MYPLVTGDVNLSYDAFLKDRDTGAVTLVSVPDGLGFANDDSYFPVVSDDGRYVAFESYPTNLVTGDTNAKRDIFVRDVVDETTIRVSVDSSGTQANGHSSSPRITPDGRYVAFHSAASNLVSGDTNAKTDVFVRDLVDGTTVRVSLSSTGTQGNDSSFADGISADGRFVAMSSNASNLVAGDSNVREDIFVHDRSTGTTERVSVDSAGTQANGGSDSAALSDDGRYVAFESVAPNLVADDTNAANDIFMHDRSTGETIRVSIDSSGGQANGGSYLPAISADGGVVAFESPATSLVAGDTNSRTDIFVRRIAVGITERASVSSGVVEANGNSFLASVAGDGGFVTFDSLASNLIAGDGNGTYDTFVRELGPPPTGEAELIYVHGVTRSFQDPGFGVLLDPLIAEFGDRIAFFEYYQDRGGLVGGVCGAGEPSIPAEPHGGIPYDITSIDPTICDSQSDLAFNAVKLGVQVQAAYQRSGKKVVLLGHSMGVAIIRGFLAYSAEHGDGIAATMVDGAVFLAGAQDGSRPFEVAIEMSNQDDNVLQRMVMGRILDEIPINKDRPAVDQLLPRSDWYEWANPDAAHLPNIPYFNVYGDISVIEERCAWLWCHEPATLFTIGDLAILAGTDDPFDVPGSGGARMLNGAPAAQNWQWRLSAEVEWTWWLDPTYLYVVGELLGRPENHFKLSSHLGDIEVADCQTGQSTELSAALLSIVRGRLTGDPYDCQP